MQWHVEQTGDLINTTQKQFGDKLNSLHDNVRQNNTKLIDHDDRISQNLRGIEDLQNITSNHEETIK